MDKNDNGMPDKWETYFTYIIAMLAVIVAIIGLATERLQGDQVIYLFVIAAVLTGNRDLLPFLLKRK